jgi:hypothetical protein
MKLYRALTIAGSDSGGGAGVQADLKTFAALGVYGSSVIAAVTAQNTLQVSAIHVLPASIVAEQLTAVLSDIGADAIKTGMLANAEIIQAVATTLRQFPKIPLVLDPVMVAKSGDTLLTRESVETLRTGLRASQGLGLPLLWISFMTAPRFDRSRDRSSPLLTPTGRDAPLPPPLLPGVLGDWPPSLPRWRPEIISRKHCGQRFQLARARVRYIIFIAGGGNR